MGSPDINELKSKLNEGFSHLAMVPCFTSAMMRAKEESRKSF
jgi:hypothetical protein